MIFHCTLNIWGILMRLWVSSVSPVLAGLLVTPREWGLWGAASCCCHVRAKVQVPPQPPPCWAEGNHSFIPTAPEQVGAPVPHVASTDSTLGPRGRVPCYMEQRWKCSLLWPQPEGGWGNLITFGWRFKSRLPTRPFPMGCRGLRFFSVVLVWSRVVTV